MIVSFASINDVDEIITFLSRSKTFISSGRRYFQSWKWYKLDLERSKISELIAGKMIIVVRTKGTQEIGGLAITNDRVREKDMAEQMQREDQAQKQITNEEDDSSYNGYDDPSFQLVYLDAPTSAYLENLLVFVVNWVVSTNNFDRIQLFMPKQVYHENSDFYKFTEVLAKFGISKSESFLLYIRSI